MLHIIISASFFPATLGSWAATIGVFVSTAAAILGLVNRKRIQQVHVLVNSNLTEIKEKLALVTAERDKLNESQDSNDTD